MSKQVERCPTYKHKSSATTDDHSHLPAPPSSHGRRAQPYEPIFLPSFPIVPFPTTRELERIRQTTNKRVRTRVQPLLCAQDRDLVGRMLLHAVTHNKDARDDCSRCMYVAGLLTPFVINCHPRTNPPGTRPPGTCHRSSRTR